MRRKGLAYGISVLLALTAVLSACSGTVAPKEANKDGTTQQPVPTASKKSPTQLSIGAGSQGGVYYPVAVGMSEVISKNLSGTKLTPEVTGASTENMVLVANGEVEIGITTAGDVYKAAKGLPPYDKVYNNVSVMFAGMKSGAIQIVVLKDSPIKSIADLKGKKVSLGPQGGGGWQVFADILPKYGLKLEDLKASYLAYQDSIDQVGDGNLDAAVISSAPPTPAVTQLASTKGIRLLKIEKELLDAHLKDRPYEARLLIKKGTYPGLTEDLDTWGTINLVAVSDDISDELVYNMTKAVFEHLDQLHSIHASAQAITLESATDFKALGYHPGAAKYFKEKGKEVPVK